MGNAKSQLKLVLEVDNKTRHNFKLIHERNIIDHFYLFFKPKKPISFKTIKYFNISIIKNKNIIDGHKINLNKLDKQLTNIVNGKVMHIYTYQIDGIDINFKINDKGCLYEISYTSIANSLFILR